MESRKPVGSKGQRHKARDKEDKEKVGCTLGRYDRLLYASRKVPKSNLVDKIQVEFLRVNHWIKQWFDIDYSEYTHKEGGYEHLPLDKKIEYISKVKKKEISVCEDCTEHYNYWKQNVNFNKDDCCNLRRINNA